MRFRVASRQRCCARAQFSVLSRLKIQLSTQMEATDVDFNDKNLNNCKIFATQSCFLYFPLFIIKIRTFFKKIKIMKPKIKFWLILVSIKTLISGAIATPASAASSSSQITSIDARVDRVRAALLEQNSLNNSLNLEGERLLSQWQNDTWYDSWYNYDWGNDWYNTSDWDNTNWTNNWYNGGWDNYTWDNWDNT